MGDVPREAGVARTAGTSAWRQAFDFGKLVSAHQHTRSERRFFCR